MVLSKDFKEEMIVKINNDLGSGELGTSDDEPDDDQSDLINGVTDTREGLSGSKSGRQLIITHDLNSTTGNDYSYKEYGNFLSGGIMINRTTFESVPKTTAIELQTTTIVQAI